MFFFWFGNAKGGAEEGDLAISPREWMARLEPFTEFRSVEIPERALVPIKKHGRF